MKDTKENILDVAECLFAQNGFAGTSVRSIVEGAEVNIAAINYHFKSKEGLFIAVIKRRFSEIEAERFAKLDQHLSENNEPTLEGVVRAFLEPLRHAFETNNQVPMMLIRVFCESSDLKELINPIFDETKNRFYLALRKVYKNLSDADVSWRFQYMISSMVGSIIFAEDIQQNIKNTSEKTDMIEHLITQILTGIKE